MSAGRKIAGGEEGDSGSGTGGNPSGALSGAPLIIVPPTLTGNMNTNITSDFVDIAGFDDVGITIVHAPTQNTDAVILSFRAMTVGPLPACTAAGAGVGKTLTGNANGALVIDGQTLLAGDVVLVKNQAAGKDNGGYTVTQVGTAGTPFILTRTIGGPDTTAYWQTVRVFFVQSAQAPSSHSGYGRWFMNAIIAGALDTAALVFYNAEPQGVWYVEVTNSDYPKSVGVNDIVWQEYDVNFPFQPGGAFVPPFSGGITGFGPNGTLPSSTMNLNLPLIGFKGLRIKFEPTSTPQVRYGNATVIITRKKL